MIHLKACPRCNGDLHERTLLDSKCETHGLERACLQCGWAGETKAPPPMAKFERRDVWKVGTGRPPMTTAERNQRSKDRRDGH